MASAKVTKHRLEWLGHVARMPEQRMTKIAFFVGLNIVAHKAVQGGDGRMCCGEI